MALTIMTDFGDLAILLPLVATVMVWLLFSRARRAAIWWGVAIGLAMGGVAVLKIYFHVCPPIPELRSPSGHTGLATLVYGALAAIVIVENKGWKRFLLGGGAVSLIVLIAVSRIVLHAHSWVEVLLGLLIGTFALVVFAFGYVQNRPAVVALRPLLLAVVILIVLLHGQQLRAEEFFQSLGIYLYEMTPGVCG